MRRRREDLRDHVARSQDDHLLARPDVLATQVFLVVQSRELDGHAPHGDRLEHRVGVQVTKFPGVPADLVQLGDGCGRCELPGDRPTRLAPHHSEPALKLDVVELDDHAVDFEIERVAAVLPGAALLDHRLFLPQQLHILMHRKTVRP